MTYKRVYGFIRRKLHSMHHAEIRSVRQQDNMTSRRSDGSHKHAFLHLAAPSRSVVGNY